MKRLCKNKKWKIDKDYDINKILYLLIDRPARINSFNDFLWNNNKDQLHRDYDLPAYIDNKGYIDEWWKNNKLHRENNKPVRIWNDGKRILFE